MQIEDPNRGARFLMRQPLTLPDPAPDGRPQLSARDAAEAAEALFSVSGAASELPSYADQNFRVGEDWVLKVANAHATPAALEAQHAAIGHLASALPRLRFPEPRTTSAGDALPTASTRSGGHHVLRMLSWVRGVPWATSAPHDPEALRRLGGAVGEITVALADFQHPGAQRELDWDLVRALPVVLGWLGTISGSDLRERVHETAEGTARRYGPLIPSLPQAVAHNDLNDHNLLIDPAGSNLVGVIDFGDLVHTARIADLVVAATYQMLGSPDPVGVLHSLASGFRDVADLSDLEWELLLPLVRMRLCQSIVLAARTAAERGGTDEYLEVSQEGVRTALSALAVVDDRRALDRLRGQVRPSAAGPRSSPAEVQALRDRVAGSALSLSYRAPLHIVRGRGAYLYDAGGHAYLDCVNNVAHVGHEHPRVVEALAGQAGVLNTNTRYLHDLLPRYAERLLATFGPPFTTCYLVCSGSEANELALRMARAVTGGRNVVVLDGAYHGNTSALVEMSPYKYKGRSGLGRAPWVEEADLPDPFRGRRRGAPDPASAYALSVAEAADRGAREQGGLAAFFAESILSCGGQIVPPPGYLPAAYQAVRDRGGVVVADEVQVGFGRVGSHWWGWQEAGALPDIVTLGKPIGNGHPMGAVITTSAVADAFANGMEYFNTFGGNPVSCAVGLAVLDVIEAEGLRSHAHRVGTNLLDGLRDLTKFYPEVGEARGRGLFLGLELVRGDGSRLPDPDLATALVERAKEADSILLSTDGPDHNVIKIKPPLPFSDGDATLLLNSLSSGLAALTSSPLRGTIDTV